LFGISKSGFRICFVLIHYCEWKRYAQSDRAFVRTGLNARIAVPALIFVGDRRDFTYNRPVENIARTGIGAFAAMFAFIFVDHRRHIFTPNPNI